MIALTGWRVAVSGEPFYWFYHATQTQGFKLNGFTSAPIAITQAALRDAAQRSRRPIGQLQVNWVEPKTWSNGCFDLSTGGAWSAVRVPGWQVTIAHPQKYWVHRRGKEVGTQNLSLTGNPAIASPTFPELTLTLDTSDRILAERRDYSPDQNFGTMVGKATDYLAAEVLHVWIVDPRAKSITVFYPDAPPRTFTGETVLTDAVLPDLQITAQQVFQQAG
ncbi:Uma2 family endonuclease [Trichothermofontia sp.]